MSYKSDYSSDAGWSIIDTNIKMNGPKGNTFRAYLKQNGVHTVIRYYASSHRSKTISAAEAKVLSADGFNILPVYQDNARKLSDFGGTNGEISARNALKFAADIGQPDGSTILFAVDTDFSQSQINKAVVPYFEALNEVINGRFRIGVYGSGATLSTLVADGLVEVPWLSMSRAFQGTKGFFYNDDWAMRQVPPDRRHPASGFGYDRNVVRWDAGKLGAFRVGENGVGAVLAAANMPPHIEEAPSEAGNMLYVKTEGLAFRDVPNGGKFHELTIGTSVKNLGVSDVQGWRDVEIDGQRGVVFDRYLRRPEAPETEALLACVISEWVRFDKGQGREKKDPYKGYVGEMWQSIGLNYDGASTDGDGIDIPWSAAFISFVVKNAGPKYAQFLFSQAHSRFAHDAIQARYLGDMSRPFWGYRRSEVRPGLGDIVHRNRGNGNRTFDWAETHSRFTSHADIVIEVRDDVIRVMGGNVGNTVTTETGDGSHGLQEYKLDKNGLIGKGQRVISVLKNRAAGVLV